MEEIITAGAEAAADSVAVSEEIAPKKKRKPINQQKLQDNLWGWAFCVPLIVGTVLFVYTALVIAVMLSFTAFSSLSSDSVWSYLGKLFSGEQTWGYSGDALYWYKFAFCENKWCASNWGTDNGITVDWLTGETVLQTRVNALGYTLFNTVFYLIGIPVGMVLSMFFAVCMSRDIKGGNVFRVLYYIPCVASTVAIVYTFQIMFKYNGVINQMLGTSIPWFAVDGTGAVTEVGSGGTVDTFWSQGFICKSVIIVMSVWKGLGGTIILYVAGLSGVNAATKEAAQIDGASGWTIFWKVTMPDLYPVIFYNIVTAVIGGMQIYAEPELFFGSSSSGINVMTSGYVALIWYYGVGAGQATVYYGQGAAYGMILAVIIFILTLFQFWLDSRKKD